MTEGEKSVISLFIIGALIVMLGIAGYQAVELAIQRKIKKGENDGSH